MFACQCFQLAECMYFDVQAVSLDLQAQIAAAVSAERFSEDDALQAELDAASADAAALQAAQHFTDGDLGSSLKSLSDLSTAQGPAALTAASSPASSPALAPHHAIKPADVEPSASAQPAAAAEHSAALSSPPLSTVAEDSSILQPLASSSEPQPENGSLHQADAIAEPHVKLGEVAASEAGRPALPRPLQEAENGSRQQLAAIGLNRQLTDERTLSGYITDSDSAADVIQNVGCTDSERSGSQLPGARQLQSAKSREALTAVGLDRQCTTRRMPSGYLADSDSQELGNLKHHASMDSTAATVASSR